MNENERVCVTHLDLNCAYYPGTVVRGARNLCITCYSHRPASAPSAPRAARIAYDVGFAIIPDARHPQQSDCKVSCCKTPYLCAIGYRCACHTKETP